MMRPWRPSWQPPRDSSGEGIHVLYTYMYILYVYSVQCIVGMYMYIDVLYMYIYTLYSG